MKKLWPILLWWFLTASVRSNRSDPSSLTLDAFKFDQAKKVTTPSPYFHLVMGGMFVGVVLVVIWLVWLNKRKAAQQILRATQEKANMRLEMFLKNMNLASNHRRTLEKLAGSKHPDVLLPLVESNHAFEHQVEVYKDSHQSDTKLYGAIHQLRHALGFEFSNRRFPFICTQMLNTNLRLECQIPHPEKKILFISPILDVTETRILVKPPTLRGKPANLKLFPHLICKIRRGNDAEYQFQLSIINQISGKLSAVVLKHSNAIKKLFLREFERVDVQISNQFFIVPEAEFTPESDDTRNTANSFCIDGIIDDMSVGGMKVSHDDIPEEVKVGDLVVFHLQGANLREDLLGRILNVSRGGDRHFMNVQFFNIQELARTKVNKFLFTIKRKRRAQRKVQLAERKAKANDSEKKLRQQGKQRLESNKSGSSKPMPSSEG